MKNGTFCLLLSFLTTILAGSSFVHAQQSTKPIADEKLQKEKFIQEFSAIELFLRSQKNTKSNLLEVHKKYQAIMQKPEFTKYLSIADQANAYANIALSKMRLGNLSSNDKAKISYYLEGESFAQKAIKLNPSSPRGHFFEIINSAKRSKTQGLFSSAMQIGKIFERSKTLLKKHPNYFHNYNALGQFYFRVPSLLGGDEDKAAQLFQSILKKHPNYTAAKMSYAELLISQGEKNRAKKLLEAIINEPKALRYYDWKKFDRPRARLFLQKVQ